jgi:hypothetical protein
MQVAEAEESKVPLDTAGRIAREQRIEEAEAALRFAKESAASDGYTRASATNALGRLRDLAGDTSGAAGEYLDAAQAFETIKEWDSAAVSCLNAANVLSRAARRADASAAARDGLKMLSHAEQQNAGVARALQEIAAEGAGAS